VALVEVVKVIQQHQLQMQVDQETLVGLVQQRGFLGAQVLDHVVAVVVAPAVLELMEHPFQLVMVA
jgi:hypothetical protein